MFVFLEIVELLMLIFVLSIFLTQIVIPVLYGRPIFPFFDRKKSKLKERERSANDEIEEVIWEKKVIEKEKAVETLAKHLKEKDDEKTNETTCTPSTDTNTNEKE